MFGALKNLVSGKVQQFSGNKDFLEGVCASCALVASADGSVSDSEATALIKAVTSNKTLLSAFTSQEIERTADLMIKRAQGGRVGRNGLFTEIDEVKNKDKDGTMSEAILLSALDVADDGGIGDDEKVVLEKIAERLRLDLKKYL